MLEESVTGLAAFHESFSRGGAIIIWPLVRASKESTRDFKERALPLRRAEGNRRHTAAICPRVSHRRSLSSGQSMYRREKATTKSS